MLTPIITGPSVTYRTLGLKRTDSMPLESGHSEISQSGSLAKDIFVLVPEDNEVQRKLMKKRLETAAKAKKKTIHIDFAKNFTEARNFIIQRALLYGKKYDALLTDNQMQDSDGNLKDNVGIDLLKWIQKHPKLEPISRAMYSADDVKKEATEKNRVHFFFKKTESKAAAERVVGNAVAAKPLGNDVVLDTEELERRSLDEASFIDGYTASRTRIPLSRAQSEYSTASHRSTSEPPSPLTTRTPFQRTPSTATLKSLESPTTSRNSTFLEPGSPISPVKSRRPFDLSVSIPPKDGHIPEDSSV